MEHHQTCQRLRDASLDRPVWLSLVQWYSDTIQPRPFWLEKPLILYKDRELECLILRWQSGKTGRALAKKLAIDTRRLHAGGSFTSRWTVASLWGSRRVPQ